MLPDCLGGLKPMIMSNRNQGLLYVVPSGVGVKFRSCYLRFVCKNFMFVVRKPKVGCDVSKVLVNKMFNMTICTC